MARFALARPRRSPRRGRGVDDGRRRDDAVSARRSRDGENLSVMKAGGIDLLDLHEGGPAGAGESRQSDVVPGLIRLSRTRAAAFGSGLWSRWRARRPSLAASSAIPSSSTPCVAPRNRKSATSDARRQSLAAAALLVFSRRGISLPAQGWRALLASPAKTSITRSSATPARSSILRRSRPAGGARRRRVELTDAAGPGAQRIADGFFRATADARPAGARTTSKPATRS